MNRNFMKSNARRRALQILYALDINSDADAEVNTAAMIQAEGQDLLFAEVLINTVKEHLTEIDSMISAHLRKWSINQLNVVDKCILRIGIAELLFVTKPSTEKGVTINGAVILAKEYGGANSYRFINGVLQAVAEELHVP